MTWFIISYFVFSSISSALLLSTPYLRITSLGWFIAIWCLPIAGAWFFILTVVRRSEKGIDHNYCRIAQPKSSMQSSVSDPYNRLGVEHEFLPYFSMEKSKVLRDKEFIDHVMDSIDKATQRIWITTYIFSGDVKETLLQKLTAAYERGVEVRLIIDRVGSGLLFAKKSRVSALQDLPFHVRIFHQSRTRSMLFIEKRLHSKIIIVDRQDAFIGAHNLRDEVIQGDEAFVHNVSLKFSGSVVKQLESIFADLWLDNCQEDIADPDLFEENVQGSEGAPARIIFSDPIARTQQYNQYLTLLLIASRKRIYIWMPYVIPTHTMRNTIIGAAKLGMDVKVLMPKKSDSLLVDNAHGLVLHEFTDHGVNCAVSVGSFDHSKILIIDDLVILGSTNLDYRSLYRNYETNIEVHDGAFSRSIVELFETEFAKAEKVDCIHLGRVKNMFSQFTSLIAGLY